MDFGTTLFVYLLIAMWLIGKFLKTDAGKGVAKDTAKSLFARWFK
jgi:hypothetical protein